MTNQEKQFPFVSVIIPAYNEEPYIAETIESILEQSLTDFELIIVDDGSTDGTYDVASSYNDSRIQVYQQKNAGPAKARNKALQKARGSYIALQDADDRSKPDRLIKQYSFLNKNLDCIAVGTHADILDKDGEFIYKLEMPLSIPENWPWDTSPIIHPSVMFRADILKKVGGYPDMPVSQDTLFLLRMNRYGKFMNIQEALYEYRINPTSISRKNSEIRETVKSIIENFQEKAVLNTNKIKRLKNLKNKQSDKEKKYQYHLLLAKKYLWNNYSPSKARGNLAEAMKVSIRGFQLVKLFALYLLSFMGEKIIYHFYRYFKF